MGTKEFRMGEVVLVKTLRKKGTITAVLKPGLFEVLVGGFRARVKESDLKAAVQDKELTTNQEQKSQYTRPKLSPSADLSIDLHGLRVAEELAEVEKTIDRAIMEGYERLKIVHGIGQGKVRSGLHSYLKTIAAVKHFELDQHNQGVTWVYF